MRGFPLFFAVFAAALGPNVASAAELPQMPSGLEPELLEEFIEVKPDGRFTYARFRFVVPEIAGEGAPEFDVIAEDLMMLCRDYALPRLAQNTETIDKIVISYSDRPLEFGASDPDSTQVFEQFSIVENDCTWEQF